MISESQLKGDHGTCRAKSPPLVAVVVPVLNEAHVLEKSVDTLRLYLHHQFSYPAEIVIVDNGSTDGTAAIGRKLAETHSDVRLVCLAERGKGWAVISGWKQSKADILAFMDIDLSTELEALETLCRGIHQQGYDIATGSRMLAASQTTRCLKREVLSRGYNLFVKCILFTKFSDAQCGFKAVSRRVVENVVPLIRSRRWFFDTELLVLGEKLGCRIMDVPVRWNEDPDTRVRIGSVVREFVKGVLRLRWFLWRGGHLDTRRRMDAMVAAPIGITSYQVTKIQNRAEHSNDPSGEHCDTAREDPARLPAAHSVS